MREVRCPHCNWLLFMARVADVEIKCRRCRRLVRIKVDRASRTAE